MPFQFSHCYSRIFGIQQQQPCHMGLCTQSQAMEGGSQQQSFGQAHSSSTIMDHIGSPASAFYATEWYMGLPQYEEGNLPLSHQLPDNYDLQQIPSYQSPTDNFCIDSPEQANPDFQSNNPLHSSVKSHLCSSQYKSSECTDLSEGERILKLKRKNLADFDNSDRRHPSTSFAQNQDFRVCNDLYSSPDGQLRQAPRPPDSGPVSVALNNSVPPGLSSKTRIRWSQDLHDRFVESVDYLGGAEKATPKAILNRMGTEGLTIYHVKSHLQKYRNIAKYVPESAEAKSEKRTSTGDVAEIDINTLSASSMQMIKEAQKLQLDVQRRLHEQLEIQRKLQLRIEEQAKKIEIMFDQHQDTTNKSLFEMQISNISSPDDPST
ncbi:hypothetical protein F0562_017184 [Nyssa sinensis]|uniref:HTH myb-type domain-containing protein n=1 Tax=Nyssa sinensis TaxID=561372 RepID=A0A5J4ZHI2_9ASTE|nr:hypothetical protein F0562_017184 [Nyssa sinensis]